MLFSSLSSYNSFPKLKDPRILIIKEAKESTSFYKIIFDRLNIKNVTTVTNLLEILHVIKETSPNVILADLTGSNELKAIKTLDKLESIKDKIPVIVICSSINIDIKSRVKAFHHSDIFVKPVDVIQFARTINKFLSIE